MSWRAAEERYERMIYNRCGRSGLRLPAISLGLWHNFGGTTPFESGRAMVRRAFDLGITHFDLANNYGPPPSASPSSPGAGRNWDESRRGKDSLPIRSRLGYPSAQATRGSAAASCRLIIPAQQIDCARPLIWACAFALTMVLPHTVTVYWKLSLRFVCVTTGVLNHFASSV